MTEEPAPPAASVPAPVSPVTVLGLGVACWRCQESTTAVVGFIDRGVTDPRAMIAAGSDGMLRWGAALLPVAACQAHRVGTIVAPHSLGTASYVSNRCFSCGAAQDMATVQAMWAAEVAAGYDTSALVALHVVDVDAAGWDRVVREYRSYLG